MKNKITVLAMTVFVTLLTFPVFAGEYDIKVMTPAIQQAIQGRQARYFQLDQLKQAGALGENNQGYVQVRESSPAAESVAQAENYDRQVIYQAIVEQNGLGPEGMANVQAVFAEVQRGKARPGEWFQSRTGEWTEK